MEPDVGTSDVVLPDTQIGHPQSKERPTQDLADGQPPPPSRSFARSFCIVATCSFAMLVNVSNTTSVGISLPAIGRAIHIQEDQLQWLLSAYSLSSGCLLLFFGHLADLYGRKRGFLVGMLIQTIFAISLGFSNNGLTLSVLRGLQGLGAAAAGPSALGILAQAFPPSRARSIAFATFAAGAPLGGAFGNIIGSVLTQFTKEHWRSTFFMSGGLSALCVLGCLVSFDADELSSEADRRLDWIGAILITAALVLIVFVLGQAPIAGWKTPYIIAPLIIGVVLVVAFVAWEHRLEKVADDPNKPKSFWMPPPLMKPSIWARANGRMSAVLVVAFLNWCGFISWALWVLLYYQNYLGLTPVLTMVRLLPMFVTGCLCNIFVALVVGRLPMVVLFVLGTLATGMACVIFALIEPSVTYWAFGFPSAILVVFGADFVYAAGTLFVAKTVFPHEQSLAGGLFQTMTQLGNAFGLTISTIVFNGVLKSQSAKLSVILNAAGTNAPSSAQLDGYKSALWTCAAFPLFASLVAVVFLRSFRPASNE